MNSDIFAQFTSFKSTQFFVRDFKDNAELLTALPQQPQAEPSWWETDSGLSIPNWTLLLIILLLVIFIVLGTYIFIVFKRNKAHRDLQEAAIMHELELAKKEGIEIPEDLEKRLSRYQKEEEKEIEGKKYSSKVHPEQGKLTRYASMPQQKPALLKSSDGKENRSF